MRYSAAPPLAPGRQRAQLMLRRSDEHTTRAPTVAYAQISFSWTDTESVMSAGASGGTQAAHEVVPRAMPTHGGARSLRAPPWRTALSLALAVAAASAASGARAQQSGPAAPVQVFVRVESPTAIFVDPAGDITVTSEPPGSMSETRYSPAGQPLGSAQREPTEEFGRRRSTYVDTGAWRGTADVNASGVVELVPAHDAPADAPYAAFDLRNLEGSALPAVDVDAAPDSALAQVTLSSARYVDIAALATGPDEVTVFVTGFNGAGGAAGAAGEVQPVILKGRLSPATLASTWWVIATSQATGVDPEHRSGIAVQTIPPELTGGAAEGVVWATIPTAATSAPTQAAPRGPDALVQFRTTYPSEEGEQQGDAPAVAVDAQGAPIHLTTSAMGSDSAGNVYLVVSQGPCAEAAPGVLAVTSEFAGEGRSLCHALPATAGGGASASYWDVAVRNPGDPIYVTDNAGDVVLQVASTVPAAAVLRKRAE
jgi:hypothetical protein